MATLGAGCLAVTACAHVEVGVEVAKRAHRALSDVELAQAPAAQPAAVSPYLEPAPDIFEGTGRAFWDGKRTLQGIWVAHPLATTARRVRIFNTENGRAVDGALFKRDAGDGSTDVLISSEAAEMLGIPAGGSADLRIVAVTPVEQPVPAPTPAEEVAIDETEPAQTTPEAEESTPETEPAEQVALAPVEPEPQEEPQPAETPEAPPPAEPQLATQAPDPVAPTPEARPAQAEPEPEPEPEPEVKSALAPEAAPPAAEQSDGEDEPLEDIAFKWEQAPTDPETPTAADPPAAAPAPEPASDSATNASTSPLARPFIQAGVFGVPGNASRLVERLKARGIPVQGRVIRSGGRQLTKVVAGPFQTRAQRDAAQREIRQMGLRDAVPVRR